MEFFYFADGDPTHAARSRSTPASYFDLTTADVASDLRKRTIHMLEAMGIPVEYSLPRGRPSQHEIDLRYTDALSMADNVMTFRLVVREIALEQGVLRHVHAQAARAACRARACTPTCRCSRATPTPSTTPGDELRPVQGRPAASSPACCATPRRSPRSPTSWSTPTSGSIVGYEAPVYVTWARNNRSALVRVPVTKRGKRVLDPHRVPGARPGLQPLPRLLGAAGRRPQGHRGGLRAARPRQPANVFELTAEERAGRGHPAPAPVALRGARRDGAAPSWSPRRSASTSSSGSCATSGPSGPTTRPRSPSSSSTATSRW